MSTPPVPRGVGDGPGRPAPWRIATFNIRHGLGRDGRVDLARTARTISVAIRRRLAGVPPHPSSRALVRGARNWLMK